MDSAMSMKRLDREFSIDRRLNSSVKREPSESPDQREKKKPQNKTDVLI